jgi:hypothetical protein
MMGGGIAYSNRRKVKETSSSSMGESKNPNFLKCHCEKIAIIRVAQIVANFGREFFSCPLPKVIYVIPNSFTENPNFCFPIFP